MKLTIERVFEATVVLNAIIQQQRTMPQKGKYRIARMMAKLKPEFELINRQRDDMIKVYDHHPMITVPGADMTAMMVPSKEWSVPPDKMPEFTAKWAEFGANAIEIDVEPIPLSQLDMGPGVDGAIEANELFQLGELVTEDA